MVSLVYCSSKLLVTWPCWHSMYFRCVYTACIQATPNTACIQVYTGTPFGCRRTLGHGARDQREAAKEALGQEDRQEGQEAQRNRCSRRRGTLRHRLRPVRPQCHCRRSCAQVGLWTATASCAAHRSPASSLTIGEAVTRAHGRQGLRHQRR